MEDQSRLRRGDIEAEAESQSEPGPDLARMNEESPNRPVEIESTALRGLFILGVVYTLYFARELIIPLVIALLLNFLFRPVIRSLKRLRIPPPMGAALVLLVLAGTVVIGSFYLAEPASNWMTQARVNAPRVEYQMRQYLKPVLRFREAAEEVEEFTDGSDKDQQVQVQLKQTSIAGFVLEKTWSFLALMALMLLLFYFILAYEDLFLRKLIGMYPRFKDKRRILEMARDVEQHVSAYLLTATLINTGLGAALAVSMYLVGLPNALLWGVMAALLEFIPYLGPLVGIIVVAFVSLLTFGNTGYAFLAPFIYLVFETIQANFAVPLIFSRRFSLNPVVVLVWLTFWSWIWGLSGALLAVPMLTVFKIFCDHFESLAVLGEFIGTDD